MDDSGGDDKQMTGMTMPDDIDNISDATIKGHVKSGITSGFNALEQTGNYLPIIVLAVVISLVLTLVLGFTAFGGGMGGRGMAL